MEGEFSWVILKSITGICVLGPHVHLYDFFKNVNAQDDTECPQDEDDTDCPQDEDDTECPQDVDSPNINLNENIESNNCEIKWQNN